jgi:hypothetical protein
VKAGDKLYGQLETKHNNNVKGKMEGWCSTRSNEWRILMLRKDIYIGKMVRITLPLHRFIDPSHS